MPKGWVEKERVRQGSENPFIDNKEISQYGKLVTWSEVKAKTGLTKDEQISVALGTYYVGVYQSSVRQDLLARLQYSIGKDIIYPYEDSLPILLLPPFLAMLQEVGCTKAYYSQLNLKRGTIDLNDYSDEELVSLCEQPATLIGDNGALGLTCHFDSPFSLLFSTHASLEKWINHSSIEGFQCDKKTKLTWDLEALGIK
ncbi:hypothetical protein N780_04010 [Pontibacillus chungwhensis BH030062]|uniref:Uncharacterized protein n=2 Tax=Pontibacillus chungwhensis TaxID=265426 RepID=A0A0A2URT7_9BACI|nr:hypothetical protein N780_04010 [Pontibacillus chungwhensis BH030062]